MPANEKNMELRTFYKVISLMGLFYCSFILALKLVEQGPIWEFIRKKLYKSL